MKRIIILVAAMVFLLIGCAEAEESSSPQASVTSEYIDTAHDMLENYFPSEEADEQESKDDVSLDFSNVSDASNTSSEDGSDDSKVEIPSESDNESDISSESTEESDISEPSTTENESSDVPSDKGCIFLVTADIAYEDGTTATLVCTSNGDVDLYFGNGTNFTDMETKEECLKRGMALIEICEKYLDQAEKVEEYPLPDYGYTYVYMKTADGVYRVSYTNTEIHLGMEGDIEIRVLNAINNITKHAPQ